MGEIERFMDWVEARNPGEPEFFQAVEEVAQSIVPWLCSHPDYQAERILERLTEPDRAISFRVAWVDDAGHVQINRGYRIQFTNAIGPYKGGLRFHPSVTPSVLKFLGFEQIFKNSLTGLPMGGAKGGADFDPKGRSDREIMAFCQAFMTELARHIGEDIDVPAGDIGVGPREIGYLVGQYRRIRNRVTGVLTGKGRAYGGSALRTEATGYGCVYFVQQMLHRVEQGLEGKTCIISGSGNVAQFTAEKLLELGAKVVTLSDSDGFIHDPDGLTQERLDFVKTLKNEERGRIKAYADEFGVSYHEGEAPWGVPCDVAFPSATQNELDLKGVKALIMNGVMAVGEGANMPTVSAGIRAFQEAEVLFGPAKAANAGGVAVSGMEISQNAMGLSWDRPRVDTELKAVMASIHETCVAHGEGDGRVDYVRGANIGGFIRIGDALLASGVI